MLQIHGLLHGNSKDKRPDLIQFVASQLHIEKDLPIETMVCNGNTNNKSVSRGILKSMSAYMVKYGIDKPLFYQYCIFSDFKKTQSLSGKRF